MSKVEHTPTPWMIIRELGNTAICTSPHDEHAIINCWPDDAPTTGEVAISNAKFIVQACNAHDALVDVIKRYMAAYPAFRMMPVGAPGSPARIELENLMALEEEAREALKMAGAA